MNNNICKHIDSLQQWQKDMDKGCLSKDAAKHLISCEQCQKALEEFKHLDFSLYSKFQIIPKPVPKLILNNIMSKLDAKAIKDENFNKDTSILFTVYNLIFAKKTQLSVALAIVFFFIIFSSYTRNDQSCTKFDSQKKFDLLSQDQVAILIQPKTATILVDNKSIQANLMSKLSASVKYSISTNTSIKLKFNKSKIILADKANFEIANKIIYLAKGSVSCVLSGNHAGFSVKTPFAEITPLGTNFKVEVKDWGTKVTLVSGKIEVKNNLDQIRTIETKTSLYVQKSGEFSDKFKVIKTQSNDTVRPRQRDTKKAGKTQVDKHEETQNSNSSNLMNTF